MPKERYSVIPNKLKELESELNDIFSRPPPQDASLLEQLISPLLKKFTFLKTLLSSEISSNPKNPNLLNHIHQRITELETKFNVYLANYDALATFHDNLEAAVDTTCSCNEADDEELGPLGRFESIDHEDDDDDDDDSICTCNETSFDLIDGDSSSELRSRSMFKNGEEEFIQRMIEEKARSRFEDGEFLQGVIEEKKRDVEEEDEEEEEEDDEVKKDENRVNWGAMSTSFVLGMGFMGVVMTMFSDDSCLHHPTPT